METDFATGISAPVDIQVGYDGNLYYLAYSAGAVGRVKYTGSNAPAITQDPSSQLISVGHPVTFTVAASGAPTLSYQWQKNSVDIAGATSPSYTISSVVLGDSGSQYRCKVTNSFGTATSAQATLTVTTDQPPTPTITAPPSNHGALVAAPYWVKLVRSGNTLSGYASSDGVAWTLVGSDTVSMTASVYVGLPVTSHSDGVLSTATFTNVSATSP